MSNLQTLLDDLSTYISQSSTSNLNASQRIRYLDMARKGVANAHDWTFLYKEADLGVTLKGENESYASASMPSDIKSYKIRSIYYAPNQTEYVGVDENQFLRDDGKMFTVGYNSTTAQLRIKGVDGVDGDADGILADQSTSSSSTTAVTTFLSQPDVPRVILFTPGGTTGDIAAGNITVVGTDMKGASLTENVAITENQTATSVTTGHFRTITSITFPQMDGDGATFDVGTSQVVGLRIRYLFNLTAYSTTSPDPTQASSFPDEMDEVLVLGAVYRIFMKFNRSDGQIGNYKTEYLDALQRAWVAYGRDIKAQPRQIVNARAMSYKPISSYRY